MAVRHVKIKISVGISSAKSESLISACRNLGPLVANLNGGYIEHKTCIIVLIQILLIVRFMYHTGKVGADQLSHMLSLTIVHVFS